MHDSHTRDMTNTQNTKPATVDLVAMRRELANTIALQAAALASGDIASEATQVALLVNNIDLLAAWTPTPNEEFAARKLAR